MDKITYFDVEYANSKNKSICQIGIMCENISNGNPIYPERDIYINPEDGFDDVCTRIHGITPSTVKDAPTFPAAWKEIESYFTNTVVVGHNVAAADLDALVKALRRYNLDVPEFYYICTMELAQEYVPSFAVRSYGMGDLCEHFCIDIESAHDAFDDACANADLLRTLVDTYSINLDAKVRRYIPRETKEFTQFVSSPLLRKSISEFYGTIRGFSIDNRITEDEAAYILKWRRDHAKYSNRPEIFAILSSIDKISEDGIITLDETISLQGIVKNYLDVIQSSPVTLATQILSGIMKGIVLDGEITDEECKNLRQWLYDNIYLTGHYPFDRVLRIIEDVLQDSVITAEESAYIMETIDELLNPVAALKTLVITVDGKHVCLSGNFSHGQKSDVQKYIIDRGGIIDSNVKKTTDILMIGDYECQAYSNGTYGTKVKKAMEYNEKGCHIQIVKECDFF